MNHVIVPTYIKDDFNFDLVVKNFHVLNTHKIFVDNGSDMEHRVALELADKLIINDENCVSRAWNKGIESVNKPNDFILIVNQDLSISDKDIERMSIAAHQFDFVFANLGGNKFSCFGALRSTYNQVKADWGYIFDEHFKPAYFEDNDFGYRMKLSGYSYVTLDNVKPEHYGSSVINKNQSEKRKNNKSFPRNKNYYVKKWGGMPSKEKFKTAFNE